MQTNFIIRPLLQNERGQAIQFIETREVECTALMEQLLKSTENVFVLEDIQNKIFCALFYIRNSSTFFHYLPFSKPEKLQKFSKDKLKEIKNQIALFLSKFRIFCVYGEYYGTLFLNSILEQNKQKIICTREYILMQNDFKNIGEFECSFKNSELQKTCYIKKCSTKDKDRLFELEKKYRQEEVVVNKTEEDKKIIEYVLNNSLLNQDLFAACIEKEKKEFAIAMTRTNAKGKNYFQIGGVFCLEEFRNQRITFCVMMNLLKQIHQEGKIANLFVRIHNESAKKLYKNLGFEECGKYALSYFQK